MPGVRMSKLVNLVPEKQTQRRKKLATETPFCPPFLITAVFQRHMRKRKKRVSDLKDWSAMRSQEPSWASGSIPGSPPCWRPSCVSTWRSADRRRYTAFGLHPDPDAILVFRLGYSCGNDQEGPPSAETGERLAIGSQRRRSGHRCQPR